MSLGDILVEILGEMMGVPIKKKQPPNQSRPVAPPPVASSPYSREDDDVYMYDDDEDEDEEEEEEYGRFHEPAPEPEMPEQFQSSAHSLEAAQAAATNAINEIYRQNYELMNQPAAAIPAQPAARPSATKVQTAGLPAGFIESIRTDNAAARAAIVSGEIFGPPVSERRDRQW